MKHLSATRLLAAIDFGDEDWHNTVHHASALAITAGASLHLVNAVAPTHWLLRKVLDEASTVAHEADLEAAAQRLLVQAKGLVPDGVSCTTEVRVGKPAVQVLAAMKERDSDLLVIGSGTPSGAALFIGGTADRLLRLCHVPVYVAGHRPPREIRRVLIPTGLGPGGAHALKVSAGFDADLVALHMIALPGVMRAYAGDIARLREAMTAQASTEFDAHVRSLQSDRPIQQILRTNLEMTKADKTILSVAREQEVDLICFALGGRGLTAGLLIGRVSEKVIRALPCPLLALPDRWIEARRDD